MDRVVMTNASINTTSTFSYTTIQSDNTDGYAQKNNDLTNIITPNALGKTSIVYTFF